jgi:hypothetical protein
MRQDDADGGKIKTLPPSTEVGLGFSRFLFDADNVDIFQPKLTAIAYA